jgi:hypothetical protein
MVIVPSGIAFRELATEIEKAQSKLGPETVHLTYRVEEDSNGVPAIFFRIILADWASREETLTSFTRRIIKTLLDEVKPIENWGLHPYFNFGSQTEFRRAS